MKLAARALGSAVFGLVFFGIALFLPAGTLRYWQAWVFIGVFTVAALLPTAYLAVRSPDALRRRMRAGPTAETRPLQRIIISVTVVTVFATLVVSAIDHRFGWSTVPLMATVIGDLVVAGGLVLAQAVIVQNAYAAATITVEAGQPLVTTGLYGVVRHPMYLGVLVMMTATPLALDSLWGLAVVPLTLLALAARIVDEETMLVEELAGYREYTARVSSRLVPGVW